ncbi:hypothetical protein [Chelatococcus asaccharovorans]|uniref:hypothetical protein n=1 Tax=Chelatococcus asaccharovorans TaxID=28210 RepID=UPI0011B57539|nr:hypothetical protein [Chelatococcus asaccharovorans]MBS7701763.1 hypothetical protein [Chelatococcus asaccharovorans]
MSSSPCAVRHFPENHIIPELISADLPVFPLSGAATAGLMTSSSLKPIGLYMELSENHLNTESHDVAAPM